MLGRFEKKYRIRSETFYAAYCNHPEPQDIDTELEFCDWSDAYLAWQARQADYRAEIQRIHGDSPRIQDLELFVQLKALTERPVTEEESASSRKFDEDLERERLTFREPNSGEMIIKAHFDGEQIRLDEPLKLQAWTPLMVIVDHNSAADAERKDWHRLSATGLEAVCGEDEPEYTTETLTEPNPDYEEE